MIVIIFGVSGAGKTTIGKLLARELTWRFIEADDFHPAENIKKMRGGRRLPTRTDGRGWTACANRSSSWFSLEKMSCWPVRR